jgi:protein TonB
MNLELPPMPELAPLALPTPPPLPPAPQPQRLARRPSRARSSALSGVMVMNGLSFSGAGSPSGGFTQGMNLNLSQSRQRAYYPEIAGEMGQSGTSVIRFTVNRAGHVSHLEIVSPTGYALLDQAWLGLFRGADLPPFGPDATSNSITVTASMHFEIIR